MTQFLARVQHTALVADSSGTPDPCEYGGGPCGELLDRRVSVFKALAHSTRCRIVEILGEQGSKCVSDLVDMLKFDQSTISKHLGILKNAGIVESRKDGLNVIYRLRLTCVYRFLKCVDSSSCCPTADNSSNGGMHRCTN